MRTLIKDATIINEGSTFKGSVLIEDRYISEIFRECDCPLSADITIDASSLILIPGVIDDHVHFREPGATHKGDIGSESAAAALGGVTTFMDMPNNNPPATSIELLEKKFEIAKSSSLINYSFYIGANNSNIEEILSINPKSVCGVKLFMGSSTGNMLVNNSEMLERVFRDCPTLIATHCEDEETISKNTEEAINKFGIGSIPISYHSVIRSREACIKSTKSAIDMALKFNSRLHILHVSTKEEIEIIEKARLVNPLISFEICLNYLLFCEKDYDTLSTLVKCNPSLKSEEDMIMLRKAVKNVGAIGTDHAPHLLSEKMADYLHAPSGIPSIQHSLSCMFQLAKEGNFSFEDVVEGMCHAPAKTFRIKERGFVRKGFLADLVLIDPNPSEMESTISKESIHYKCGWSPLEGKRLDFRVKHTFVNGKQVVNNGTIIESLFGERVEFLS